MQNNKLRRFSKTNNSLKKNLVARKVRDLKQTENGVQLRNEAADVRLIEQILDPLLESMLGIRFRKKDGSLGAPPNDGLLPNKCRH